MKTMKALSVMKAVKTVTAVTAVAGAGAGAGAGAAAGAAAGASKSAYVPPSMRPVAEESFDEKFPVTMNVHKTVTTNMNFTVMMQKQTPTVVSEDAEPYEIRIGRTVLRDIGPVLEEDSGEVCPYMQFVRKQKQKQNQNYEDSDSVDEQTHVEIDNDDLSSKDWLDSDEESVVDSD